MKLLGFVLLVLFGAVWLAHAILDNPGYVLIVAPPWSVETSLAVFVGLLGAVVIAAWLAWQLLHALWLTPREVSRWRSTRRRRQGRESLHAGLVSLAEGNWEKAEKQLLAALHDGDQPLLNYLAAAVCAQQQGQNDKRDDYLARAHAALPEARLAIGVVQAELQYATRQYERARATLTDLRVQDPKNPHVLNRLARLYRALRDWESLANLIPDLRRRKALPEPEVDALELEVHRELLRLSIPAAAADVLQRAWNAVPKALRHDPGIIAPYARQLIRQNQMDAGESLLASAIEREWNGELVRLYGTVRAANPAAQLETAEAWLQLHGEDPDLLLTLGRLALAARQPAKARPWLEQCASRGGNAECFAELSRLLEEAGDRDQALRFCRDALARREAATAPR